MLSNAIRGHMAELGIISAKGRNGTAELLEIIANEQDDRIPAAARFSLDVLARQYAVVRAEIVAIEKRIHADILSGRPVPDGSFQTPRTIAAFGMLDHALFSVGLQV